MWQSWNIWDNVRTKVESFLDFRNLLFYIFSKLYCSLTVFSNPQECEETVNDGWMSVRLNVFIKGLWWIWKGDRWTQQLQSHVGRLLILSSVELTRPRNVSSSVVMTDRHRQQLLRSHQSRRDIGCFRKLNLALKQMLLFHHVMFVFCLRVLVWRHASYFIFNFHF